MTTFDQQAAAAQRCVHEPPVRRNRALPLTLRAKWPSSRVRFPATIRSRDAQPKSSTLASASCSSSVEQMHDLRAPIRRAKRSR